MQTEQGVNVKAMILAAGVGSRLMPLTADTPKALIKLNGKTMLQHNIEKLIAVGITNVVINVHYLAHKVLKFLDENDNFGITIQISDESEKLLDTGGAIKKASPLLAACDQIIVQNVDIISDISYANLIKQHLQNKALATLAVQERIGSRYLLFNNEYDLCGWENVKTGEKKMSRNEPELKRFGFSGVQIINPKLLNNMPASNVFSIIDVYLALAKQYQINGFEHSKGQWFDVGTIDKLRTAELTYRE